MVTGQNIDWEAKEKEYKREIWDENIKTIRNAAIGLAGLILAGTGLGMAGDYSTGKLHQFVEGRGSESIERMVTDLERRTGTNINYEVHDGLEEDIENLGRAYESNLNSPSLERMVKEIDSIHMHEEELLSAGVSGNSYAPKKAAAYVVGDDVIFSSTFDPGVFAHEVGHIAHNAMDPEQRQEFDKAYKAIIESRPLTDRPDNSSGTYMWQNAGSNRPVEGFVTPYAATSYYEDGGVEEDVAEMIEVVTWYSRNDAEISSWSQNQYDDPRYYEKAQLLNDYGLLIGEDYETATDLFGE